MKILISISRPLDVDSPYTGSNGLYSAVTPTTSSSREISTFCREANLQDINPDHCTVMYSETAVNNVNEAKLFTRSVYKAVAIKLKWWPGHDKKGYLVLVLDSPELQEEHNRLKDLGAVPTFNEYVPHITLKEGATFQSRAEATQYMKYGNLLLSRTPLNLTLSNQIVQDLAN